MCRYAAIFKHAKDELGFCYYLIPCGKDDKNGQCGNVTVRALGPAVLRWAACVCFIWLASLVHMARLVAPSVPARQSKGKWRLGRLAGAHTPY